MSPFKLLAPVVILLAGLFLSSTQSLAKPDYTRRTNKPCEFCHPPNSRELNDAGKYYRDHNHSLQGYRPDAPSKKSQ
jgi:hypothetical protein